MPYIGSSASPLPVNFAAVQAQSFNGTGSQTAFTLNRTIPGVTAIEVLVNNVQQSPYDGSYSVTGTTLTFSEAPSAGTSNVYVVYRDQAIGSLVDESAYRRSEVDSLLAGKIGTGSGTVVQSNLASNVAGTGPAFSAKNSGSLSIPPAVNTLAAMNTEVFDVNSAFNNTGSTVGGIPAYAFKPAVAGYYLVTVGMQYAGPTYGNYFVGILYKNGTGVYESVNGGQQYAWAYLSVVIYLDGVNDYLQVYLNQQQGGTQNCSAIMSAALVRAA